MRYQFPFGQELHPVVQEDQTPKKVFVLGVYASAVHARWTPVGQDSCPALAVASEPCIFWRGDRDEAARIIEACNIPEGAGKLELAAEHHNGPSGRALDSSILEPLRVTRQDAWLCNLLPEARLNDGQLAVIEGKYNLLIDQYGLNAVTVPPVPTGDKLCNDERIKEITAEIHKSEAEVLILLGDAPIEQYLAKVAKVDFKRLNQYAEKHGYGKIVPIEIEGKLLKLLPMTHPYNIIPVPPYSRKWFEAHKAWLSNPTVL